MKIYEAPCVEIIEIKAEALMLWSGQHQTVPTNPTYESFDVDIEP